MDQVRDRCAQLRLLEYCHNLLNLKRYPFHCILLPPSGANYAGYSPSYQPQNQGTDHVIRHPGDILEIDESSNAPSGAWFTIEFEGQHYSIP